MDVTYTVCFRGVPVKYLVGLEKMIQDDIGTYTDRMSMDSATVEIVVEKKEKANAKPRQR